MKNIELSFLGVQPIEIDEDKYSEILLKKVFFDKINIYMNTDNENVSLEWLDEYRTKKDPYRLLNEVKLKIISSEYLIQDLSNSNNFVFNGLGDRLDLTSFLDLEKTKYALYYDIRFSYFILVYEIHFLFPYDILNNFLYYSATEENINKNDLYNVIRNLIVKENDTFQLGKWGTAIQRETLTKIREIIRDTSDIKVADTQIFIPNNTCNISCIVIDENHASEDLMDKFNELNKYAERLSSDVILKPFYDKTVWFSFNGRFHTIYLKNKKNKFRFQPMQFHIQYMWFIVARYKNLMNKINLELMKNDSLSVVTKYTKLMDMMINKIELLSLHDNNFKYSIEIDYKTIYVENEEKWSVPRLFSAAKEYMSFFNNYLDRLSHKKNNLFQKKQNYILLFISILQLVALISVWNDYLSLLNKKNLDIDSRILQLFDSVENLVTFDVYIPIYILVIILGILIYLFRKRKI